MDKAPHNRPTLKSVPSSIEKGPDFLTSERFEPERRRHLGAPAIRTFTRIADEWRLGEDARLRVLGFPARSTYFNWLRKARGKGDILLPVDTLLRMSAVFGIYRALGVLFDSDGERLAWLTGPHGAPTFGSQPPMDLITNGTQDGITAVRRYLDAFRGGTFASPISEIDMGEPFSSDDIVIV